MNHEFYIAKRYFFKKRRLNFITVITLISIIGLMIGTAALVVVLSVFNGFNGVVTSILVGFDPHLRIEMQQNNLITKYDSLSVILKENNSIKDYSPYIAEKSMILFNSMNKAVFIKGVDDKSIGTVSGVKEKIINGEFKFKDEGEVKSIIIGLTLSDRLGALRGDTIMLISSTGMENALTQFSTPKVLRFRVEGVFESLNKEYDNYYCFISLESARNLFCIPKGFQGIEIKCNDISESNKVKEYLKSKLSEQYIISTWYDLHKDLYSIMQVERWIAYLILCLIIAVATFNMLGSLTMTVIEKKRDIGILMAMGSQKKSIVRIFMFEGLMVGVLGTLMGCVLGLIICILQQKYGLFPLDPIYIIPSLPVEIRWLDFVTVSGASIFLSFLATLYPAKRAGNLAPIEAIRWE
jgi:lipoprotein-releasing system permease protein